MKKLILVGAFFATIAVQATTIWTVTTTCGRVSEQPMADNATADQVADMVRRVNRDLCGTTPKTVTITIN